MSQKKVAIVLFNLGGPDSPEAVKPFLFNLFNDAAIISLPMPFRYFIAKLISSRRDPVAREIYEHLDGASPLLPLTIQQANELEHELEQVDDGYQYKCFVCMRYWHPMTEQVVKEVKDWQAEHVILLPLYPQFSTTTTGSSVKAWKKEAHRQGLTIETRTICCYPTEPSFIEAHVALIEEHLKHVKQPPRLLFSAHGLPKKVINKGDPYQWQVEQTAQAVMDKLGREDLDWQVCYQSKVGPLEWIGPSTDEEIERAGAEKQPLMVIPIAFVSEHSETLVELDIEYKDLAEQSGVPEYYRVPALGAHQRYSESLSNMVRRSMQQKANTTLPDKAKRLCPPEWTQCPCRNAA